MLVEKRKKVGDGTFGGSNWMERRHTYIPKWLRRKV